MNINDTVVPKSDQLNSDDLLASSQTFTVEKVEKGSPEQPVNIHLVELPGRPYRPSKTMRRVLISIWGQEASNYAGKRFTLYRDPEVKFGGVALGGIKISHMSHLDQKSTLMLTSTRGKRAPHTVEPLVESAPVDDTASRASKAVAWFAAKDVPLSSLEAHVGKPFVEWGDADLAELKANADQVVVSA